MKNPLAKRLISLLIFAVGIGLAIWLKSAHDTGGSIEDRAIIFTPVLLLVGLAGMFFPGLMVSRGEAAPVGMRIISIVIALVGLAIGFWLRFVVFKDWAPVR